MESFPKTGGMTYKQSLPKAMRFTKEGSKRLVDSVSNQVERHEGSKAAKEFRREVECKAKERGSTRYFT